MLNVKLSRVYTRIIRNESNMLYSVQVRTVYLGFISTGWWTIVPDDQKDRVDPGFKGLASVKKHQRRVKNDIRMERHSNKLFLQVTEDEEV